jgi:ABC-2 type transport system ATP-binding protein
MSNDLAFALRGVGAVVGSSFALRDVSFELPTGYVMGLIGANGAGKTTIIRCLLGMRPIDTGEIELLGHPVPGPVALRQDVGVVLDHTYLVALSHQARLLVFDEPTSGLDPVARDELLGIVGDFLVDEGHSVLFSTHITADLDRIGDYLTLVHDGRVVRSGVKDEILEAYRVVRAGPDDLSGLVGVQLIGARRTSTGAQALVRTEEADLLGGHVLVEAPTLEEIAVHIGARDARRDPDPGREGRRKVGTA